MCPEVVFSEHFVLFPRVGRSTKMFMRYISCRGLLYHRTAAVNLPKTGNGEMNGTESYQPLV